MEKVDIYNQKYIMASNNLYYIIPLSEPTLTSILENTDIVNNSISNVRRNNSNTKAIIKIKHNITSKPDSIPNIFAPLTRAELLIELAKAEWIPLEEI